MLIGSGMLANAFKSYFSHCDIVIFASGVSNSSEFRDSEFKREVDLFKGLNNSTSKIIYFSTCSIYDPELKNSPYVQHKLLMEKIVSEHNDYLIIRLPQLVGNTKNPNNLINFLHNKIIASEEFNLWAGAKRIIIDVEDVFLITSHMINSPDFFNNIIDIAHPYAVSIINLVKMLESIAKKTAKYNIINQGASYSVDIKTACSIAEKLSIKFDFVYTRKILEKYYG